MDAMKVWFLMGTALVFFMQAGFAMVESGFTRAKNTGNIVMKNLMDFCLGTIVFILIGGPLLLAEDAVMGGLLGRPTWGMLTDFSNYDWSGFCFNLVFCATTATIVSGAMAERTKFKTYCIYSLIISAIIYPIEAFWVWNSNGWLLNLGFVDFAGSAAIHMVGGVTALIGAMFLGPRLGKYLTKSDGTVEVKAIPGHNILIGALGVFILWFGWYGFNGAAAKDLTQLGQIFATTTVSASIATVATMMFTWIKNGKPDVSMCLNGSLAGLVAVTAGCTSVDLLGAACIGLVSGILVVVAVELLDIKFHIDDPVGAVGVHFCNGLWGTFAVGLFAIDGGLFYSGSFKQLGIQCLGILCILGWTVACDCLMFFILKKTIGLRVTDEEQISGLDLPEHGLVSAYPDFVENMSTPIGVQPVLGNVSYDDAIPVELKHKTLIASDVKFTKVEILCRQTMFDRLKNAMNEIGITGMTVTNVLGCGMQKGASEYYRGVPVEVNLLPKIQVEVVVCKIPVNKVINAAKSALYTGHIGDGKIFIYDVEDVVKVRTGETGYEALKDE